MSIISHFSKTVKFSYKVYVLKLYKLTYINQYESLEGTSHIFDNCIGQTSKWHESFPGDLFVIFTLWTSCHEKFSKPNKLLVSSNKYHLFILNISRLYYFKSLSLTGII